MAHKKNVGFGSGLAISMSKWCNCSDTDKISLIKKVILIRFLTIHAFTYLKKK